ncbi:hypothetical protein [Photobacterium proteolyticum]|uniref:hypothetical protein n=1 Tax=Photobacterium proteolyticum TaxID=1903952 RepID=UPI000B210226|nr:hypothetical protein [Photobacterium proteolyticum]
MNWLESELIKSEFDGNTYKVPTNWLHLHYYEAYNILFRFENSLRVFVYTILKVKYLDKWQEVNCDGKQIKSLISPRVKHADKFGYLGEKITSPLVHLTAGELIKIILSEANWPTFKPYFNGGKDVIDNKLHEILTVRNSIAHFRPIKLDDLQLIKQNIRHVLMSVEGCLNNLYSMSTRVPTNTTDEWYQSISSLGNSFVDVNMIYSDDESWVKVQLNYTNRKLTERQSNFLFYDVSKLMTSSICTEFPELIKFCIFYDEAVLSPTLNSDFSITAKKIVNFTFNKDILVKNYEQISSSFNSLIDLIDEETKLIYSDNLARGKIIRSCSISAFYQEAKERWDYNFDNLPDSYQSTHAIEYFGKSTYVSSDYVSTTNKYPWMTSDISKHSMIPF